MALAFDPPSGFRDSQSDRDAIEGLIGRPTRFPFRIAVVNSDGAAVVIENYPLSAELEPMPTWFWLVDEELNLSVSRLEADGGVKRGERMFTPRLLSAVSSVYTSGRNSLVSAPDQAGAMQRIRGGVGGTRMGIKCLHAHLAFHLAGGWTPVGSWVGSVIGVDSRKYYSIL